MFLRPANCFSQSTEYEVDFWYFGLHFYHLNTIIKRSGPIVIGFPDLQCPGSDAMKAVIEKDMKKLNLYCSSDRKRFNASQCDFVKSSDCYIFRHTCHQPLSNMKLSAMLKIFFSSVTQTKETCEGCSSKNHS